MAAEPAARLHALAERETRRLRVPQQVLTRTARPSLHAGQVVGVLKVPGATLEILPKIGGEGDGAVRHALTRMLAVAWGLRVADSDPALLATQRDHLLEVLIRLFADRLLTAVRRGMPHRYRPREEDLPLLRGKLDITRQFVRRAVRPERLACRFDELSVDTPLNRVFKAAVSGLAASAQSAPNVRRLNELAARFEHVTDSPRPLGERVMLDRTNGAFHRLYRLARLFLEGTRQSTTMGGSEGFALLFPMNDLFEEFVGRSMQVALAPQSVRLQDRGRHALRRAAQGYFGLRPDIVVDGDIVIDTKWKPIKADEPTLGVEQSDVYQMLAYARAYDARQLVLLYPWHELAGTPGILRRWCVPGTGTMFDVATVDVGSPDSVGSTLREIVGGHS